MITFISRLVLLLTAAVLADPDILKDLAIFSLAYGEAGISCAAKANLGKVSLLRLPHHVCLACSCETDEKCTAFYSTLIFVSSKPTSPLLQAPKCILSLWILFNHCFFLMGILCGTKLIFKFYSQMDPACFFSVWT